MATVLRVKRRYDEEPQEALLLACKKSKPSEERACDEQRYATIATLAATVKSQAEDISKLVPKSSKEIPRKYEHLHKVNIHEKVRKFRREASGNNRYKVVNYFRHFNENENENEDSEVEKDKNLIVIDIESPSVLTSKENVKKEDDDGNYVYDIYFGDRGDECDFASLDHLVDVMPYTNDWYYGDSEDDTEPEDEDDSNDENNWRNDYPDSDHSDNEDDVRLAIQLGDMHLDTCRSDLSSDDEDIVYGLDPADVDNFGREYANYKARKLRELSGRSSSSSSSEVDDDNENTSDEEDPELRFL